ncbi:MAG: hypothetical protein JO353_02310, partial [Phycisphaerae bacterium]|nr:hypothetical protein [Phycisphaerae bacterium]
DGEPCGTCESCRVFAAGTHPDYHVITKELIRFHDKTGKSKGIDLSIHVLRPELIEPAGRKAALGRGKVFIIEQAELMNAQAQNSILKTLEEPAGRTLIILLTDQPGVLLPTVRSRCQTIRFTALPIERITNELIKRGHAPAIAHNAAELSEGSLGEAIRWLEDGIIASALDLTTQLNAVLAGGPATELGDWFKKSADDYAEKQLARDELSSKDQAARQANALYLRLAANYLRKRLAMVDDADHGESICAAIDAIVRAETFLDGNVNVALVFQQLGIALEKSSRDARVEETCDYSK